MKKKLFIFSTIFLSVLFSTSLLSAKGTHVVYNLGKDAPTIDPQIATSGSGVQVIMNCMDGLLLLDKKVMVQPAIAETWNISEDGKTYTFNLRKDAVWSNDKPVTAHDFLFGMKRVLEPETAAPYAYLLYYIKGAKDYNEGNLKDFDKVGLKAIDDFTYEIILEKPCAYFKYLLAFPTFFPLNEEFFNEIGGEYEYCLDADSILYNGPWILTEMMPGENGKYVFEKNEKYWNKDQIKIDKLTYLLILNHNTAANMFVSNQIDLTQVGNDQTVQVENAGEKSSINYINAGGIFYITFNTQNKFFANKKIRKAFGMAIDRGTLCDTILKNGSIPAYSFVCPKITDENGVLFGERFGNKLFNENIEEAQKLLKEGLEEIGHTGPVNVNLLYSTDLQNQACCEFFQEQLRKNLGVNVTLEPTTYQSRLTTQRQHNYDFALTQWGPDYNDPMSDLELFLTDGGNNFPDYRNPEYDKLLKEAGDSTDADFRMENMAKAEKMLMDDMAVTPIFFESTIWLVKPYVKDYLISVGVGPIRVFYWAYVENK